MKEVLTNLGAEFLKLYNSFLSILPNFAQNFINLFLLALLVVIYAIFIWKFYKYVAKKNLLELNLAKYNTSEHPILVKFLASAFYLLEYIIILPFLIFFWFAIFTLFLIFLTENLEVQAILIISATVIAAIRMTSYYNEDLSKDLAKLLPFTLLAVSILNPKFFDPQRIITQFSALSTFFSDIFHYLIFIIILETILRFFEFIFSLFHLEEIKVEQETE